MAGARRGSDLAGYVLDSFSRTKSSVSSAAIDTASAWTATGLAFLVQTEGFPPTNVLWPKDSWVEMACGITP